MKRLIVCSLTFALSLGLSAGAFAQAKPKATPAPAAAPAAAPAEKAEKKANRPLPMHTRVDSLDAKAKTFTMKRKDGVEVKHVVTATTEIKNGDAAAKFEDIKVGDYVNGLRLKKSETEYEVVKITKIGPPPPKKEKVEEKKQ
jgi:hypothetical protein